MADKPTDDLERFVRRGQAAQKAADEAIAAAAPLTPTGEAELLARVAGELELIREPLELVIQPSQLLQYAGLVQLALRHPGVSVTLRATADRFLAAARSYFWLSSPDRAPALLELLARGDDPGQDHRSPDVFTASDRLALAEILGEYLRTPGHTEEFIDVARGVITTPEDLLRRILG